jgi:hypothetical protein
MDLRPTVLVNLVIVLIGAVALICGTVAVTHYTADNATVQAGDGDGGGGDQC